MDNNDVSCEPMDVDVSSQSANAMDISYNTSVVEKFEIKEEKTYVNAIQSSQDFKPEIINELYGHKILNHTTLPARDRKNNRSTILLSVLILFISFILIQMVNFKCSDDINLRLMHERLTRRVLGQSTAVKNILKALEAMEQNKILVFYGGTGVGKTYTSSLILENDLDCNNIYHFIMPDFAQSFSSELLLGLLFCKTATIVVDDLRSNDISNIKEPLKELIRKSQNLSKNITIILLYNCENVGNNFSRKCDDSFLSDLTSSLTDLDTSKYYIKFDPLTEADLRKCIENELLDRMLSIDNFNKIMKNFNVTLDGCKGVHQKMKYLKIV